jgi:hypothetical protein
MTKPPDGGFAAKWNQICADCSRITNGFVIVGLDGSPASRGALAFTAGWGQRNSAWLVIVHVERMTGQQVAEAICIPAPCRVGAQDCRGRALSIRQFRRPMSVVTTDWPRHRRRSRGRARQPAGVRPGRFISPLGQLASLRVHDREHLREGTGETRNAMLFQGVAHVVHVDTDGCQAVHDV